MTGGAVGEKARVCGAAAVEGLTEGTTGGAGGDRKCKSMIPVMIMSCEKMLERWKIYENKEFEVFEEFRLLTSEIISRTAFGSSYLEGKNIFQMLMKLALLVSRNAHKIRLPGIRCVPPLDGHSLIAVSHN
ncbi:cytochrome P450 CYP749A22-like [Lycium ferocissimum]|uniref:cytochrome P450 CYP749A22-like n=1 Tax=Lycium ferocissimum TaxID=112874 RepID=UPI0028163BEB|nr:cytochrome P450 CYP749A22-like [Lycium ferocissimum]